MEDSFKVRVDKVFGSLSEPVTSSLWTLTDEELEKKEWARDSPTRQFDDDIVDPILTNSQSQRGIINSNETSKVIKSTDLGKELVSDLQNLDDDEDDDDDDDDEDDMEVDLSNRRKSNNEDDDEVEVRASIGRDCTLDFEEEEDEYDKVAIGKEKSGERLYLKDVNDYSTTGVNTFHERPAGFNDVARDPRANHLAAKLRLKEDSEASCGSHELKLPETSRAITDSISNAEVAIAIPPDNIGSQGDRDGGLANPKPILKNNKTDPHVSKSHKRVRFEPQSDTTCDNTRDQNQESSNSALTITGDTLNSSSPITMDRSKYTHYTLDSSVDMDEESNRKAYADFLNLIRKPEATEMQLEADFSKPPTFTPRKASMVYRESKSKQNPGDISNDRTFPISIADEDVQDNKASAMEEDDSPVVDKGVHKSGRQYRTRSKINVE
ncbi:hypothetical protein Leryth_009275 [Lithospermum erythrorhizon]|nr:hypothetical protein Leryth_009275 [Lithospermum erythrorhizon]